MHLFIVTEYATVGELFERICNGRRFTRDESTRNDCIMLIYYFVYFSCFSCYGIIFLAIVIFYLMDNYCFFLILFSMFNCNAYIRSSYTFWLLRTICLLSFMVFGMLEVCTCISFLGIKLLIFSCKTFCMDLLLFRWSKMCWSCPYSM